LLAIDGIQSRKSGRILLHVCGVLPRRTATQTFVLFFHSFQTERSPLQVPVPSAYAFASARNAGKRSFVSPLQSVVRNAAGTFIIKIVLVFSGYLVDIYGGFA
jgi:hypothetical protein